MVLLSRNHLSHLHSTGVMDLNLYLMQHKIKRVFERCWKVKPFQLEKCAKVDHLLSREAIQTTKQH